jgi:hypothetical protein
VHNNRTVTTRDGHNLEVRLTRTPIAAQKLCAASIDGTPEYNSGVYRLHWRESNNAQLAMLKEEETIMSDTDLIILIVVLVLLFGGGGGYYYRSRRRL